MSTVKLYRREPDGSLRYRQVFPTVARGTTFKVQTGKVGAGTYRLDEVTVPDHKEYVAQVVREGADDGFLPFPDDDQTWVVQQFRMNERDWDWYFEEAEVRVDARLAWRGLGHVDGNDVGGGTFNIFSLVVDADAAVNSLRTLEREDSRFKGQIIAVRTPTMEEYEVRFPAGGAPDFELL